MLELPTMYGNQKNIQNKHPSTHTHQPTNQPTNQKETLIGLNTNAMLCPFGHNID
jgi:hypothetical protein